MTNRLIDDAAVVTLGGDLDLYRAPEIRLALQEAVRKPRLIIDLGEARLVSAAALGELMLCYKQRMAVGLEAARLVVRSACVRKIFEITNLTRLWTFFESVEAACMP